MEVTIRRKVMSELFDYMVKVVNHDTTVAALIQMMESKLEYELDDEQQEAVGDYYAGAIHDDAEIVTEMLDGGEIKIEELEKLSKYISGLIFQRTLVELLYIFTTGGDKE